MSNNYLGRSLCMGFIFMKEIMNIYTLLYCVGVSILALHSEITGDYKKYFDVLRTTTLHHMCITLVGYIVEFCDHNIHLTERLIGDSDTGTDFYRKIKRVRAQSWIYIIHHIAVISLFLHMPSENNVDFCMEKYTQIHLFELSTIIMVIVTTPTLKMLFINGRMWCDVEMKLLFVVLFLGVRVFWLLPAITYDFLNHDFGKDYWWYIHTYAMITMFWIMHAYWGYGMVKKFVQSVYTGELSCKRRKDYVVKTR